MNALQHHLRILFILLSLISGFQFAQAQNSISGQVIDTQGEGLFFAHIILLNATDSSLVKADATDDQGLFIFQIDNPGDYIIQAKMIGFADTYSKPVSVEGQVDIGKIILAEDSELLAEVEIVEKRAIVEQKIDRMVINVDSRISSAGSSALDVLKQSPGILVNPQSGAITMSGKNGVIVMLDGKITRMPTDAVMQMLEGMTAENIEKIELIHTPPANFDAQSNAGFINIVMKERTDQGLNGGYNASAAYGKGEKFKGGIDMNYRKNKINLFGDYSYSFNSWPQQFTNYRGFTVNDVLFENTAVSDREPTGTTVQNARFGLDWQLSDKTIVGGLFTFFDRYWTMEAINEVRNFENKVLVNRLEIPNDEVNDRFKYHYNLNIDHSFNDRQSLIFDIDYVYIKSDNPSNYTNNFFDADDNLTASEQLRVSKVTPMDILVSKLDYVHRVSDNLSFDVGLKGTSIEFENDILVEENLTDEWVKVDIFSSLATLDEKIAASYANLSWTGKKSNLKLGLRYEYTETRLATIEEPDLVDRQFGNLFPSVFYTHQITDNNSLSLSFRKGIQRPGFWDLAPFFIFWDPNSVLTGNPTLLSAVNYDTRIAYNISTLQLSTQYSYTDNPIARWQPTVDELENTQVNGAKNFESGHLVNFTISYPWKINDWWEFRSSWTGVFSRMNDVVDNERLTFDQTSWYMNASSNMNLGNGFTMEVSGNYFSPSLAGAVVWSDFNSLNFGLQKSFDDGGRLSFNVTDILLGGNWRGEIDNPEINFQYRGGYTVAERIFRLSYSNRFGNTKLKQSRNRETGAAETLRRDN